MFFFIISTFAAFCLSLSSCYAQFTLLHSFDFTDGAFPIGDLFLDSTNTGLLFGMTQSGGSQFGGVIFSIAEDGTNFGVQDNLQNGTAVGDNPLGSLILGYNNLLYGLTKANNSLGQGTLFSFNSNNSTTTPLYEALATPLGSPTWDSNTVLLYGLTVQGGVHSLGTIFSYDPVGMIYSDLHDFAGSPGDGSFPRGSLLLANNNGTPYLYGMTSSGGANTLGTVFSIEPGGTNYNVLHSFAGSPGDGENPQSGTLTLNSNNGLLYGMTVGGGANVDGCIFSIHPDGSNYAVVYSFAGSPNDGANPYGSLLFSSSRNLFYGMTESGGANNLGCIFSFDPDSLILTLLHSFASGATNGENPHGSLILDNNTNLLFGMTFGGGANSDGIIFSYLLPPAPIPPTPTPSSNDAASITASAQTSTQQNINNFESSLQDVQNQVMQIGILNIANGTYADTLNPAIIDAATQFNNLVPVIPVWCGQ